MLLERQLRVDGNSRATMLIWAPRAEGETHSSPCRDAVLAGFDSNQGRRHLV